MKRFVFPAVLLTLVVTGCARFLPSMSAEEPAPPPQLQQVKNAEQLQRSGRFSDALTAYKKIVREYPGSDFAATAAYDIALVYVDADNPEKDYAQALTEFDAFITSYPAHQRVSEAKSWRQTIRLALDTKKENERLSKNIERLKQLDVKQEEKRLGR